MTNDSALKQAILDASRWRPGDRVAGFCVVTPSGEVGWFFRTNAPAEDPSDPLTDALQRSWFRDPEPAGVPADGDTVQPTGAA